MGPDSCLRALAQGQLDAHQALQEAETHLEQGQADPRWALPACMALWSLERYREAYELHRSYHHHFPTDTDAWVIAGMCARRLPEHKQAAEQAFLEALRLNPHRADCHYNLGNLYNDTNRHAEAACAYRASLAIQPTAPLVWHNLGIALRELEQLEEANQAMRISLRLDPLNADAWCNLGLVAHANQQFELSKRCYLHSIQVDANHSSSWVNLGMSLLEEVKPEEALPALRRGQSLNPSSPDALFNLALTLLLLGDYREGWRLYESRFTSKQFKDTTAPSTGPWLTSIEQLQEQAGAGCACLIWSEQGIGDAIQFVRYLPILQAMEIPFAFATRPSLVPLFEQWGPRGITVLNETKLEAPWSEAPHLAQLSLPRILRTDLATIPAATPYLTPPGPPPEWLLVPPPPGGIAIGLVWASNPGNRAMYRQKSLPLELLLPPLLPALHHNLVEFHSLQVGNDAAQLAPWAHLPGIHDWNGKLHNFSDTAHVVKQLDLVISVDTAVAHLAGALAIPTWVLLPSNADFRWLHQRSDSPWYSTMRLFRQAQPNHWPSAINQVVDALGDVLGLDLTQLPEHDN